MFIRVALGRNGFDLLYEPGDTIRLTVVPNGDKANDGIKIRGNNADGHAYYNIVYDRIRMQKFDGIREVFEKYHREAPEELLFKVETEFNRQTAWLDSLFSERKVTKNFVNYVKAEVHCMLSWETGRLCDEYFGNSTSPDEIVKCTLIKWKLFEWMDPLDPAIKSCLSSTGYYYTYFHELYKTKKDDIDESDVIILDVDTRATALAPRDIQSHWWGHLLYAYTQYAPYRFDYCELFKRYKDRFPEGSYIEYFSSSDICNKVEKNEVQIVNSNGHRPIHIYYAQFST